jgi:hypothetical protein
MSPPLKLHLKLPKRPKSNSMSIVRGEQQLKVVILCLKEEKILKKKKCYAYLPTLILTIHVTRTKDIFLFGLSKHFNKVIQFSLISA